MIYNLNNCNNTVDLTNNTFNLIRYVLQHILLIPTLFYLHPIILLINAVKKKDKAFIGKNLNE